MLVVGAGQSGLGTAHHLQRRLPGVGRVLVLDADPIGQRWTDRWDSLTLFTPRRFSQLPGLSFPPGESPYPGRLEMAAYLRSYAHHQHLPVRTGVRVTHLSADGAGFVATAGNARIRARHVVVATGAFEVPYRPEFARELGPDVRQLHSAEYRRPDDLPTPHVVVVGGGNSAAQLAVELARAGRRVQLAAPRPPWYVAAEIGGVSLYWWTRLTGILNADRDSPISRYLRRRGDVIVGTELRHLVRAGVITLSTHRVVGAGPGRLHLANGSTLETGAVLWCTGLRQDTSWIHVAGALDEDGGPRHRRGASPVPGLHWMGLPWQTRLNSSLINGVDRDARATAGRIARALH